MSWEDILKKKPKSARSRALERAKKKGLSGLNSPQGLKDDSGKTNRFYWMSYINSNYDLEADYNSLKSKTVEVSYTTSQFYDPRIETYRNIYIIKELVVIE